MRSKTGAYWVYCLIGLLLAGCSGQAATPTVRATTVPQATATETSVPTPTEIPPTPTPAVPQIPAAGEVLFQDDFSDEGSGVDQWSQANSGGLYVEGAYQMQVHDPHSFFWTFYLEPESYTDTIFSVDLQAEVPSTDGAVVLMCRYADWNAYYGFALRADGYFQIWKVEAGTESILLDWQYSDYVLENMAAFKMAVACIGDQLMLGMNGQLIAEVSDGSIPEGAIAWGLETFDDSNIVMTFDNLEVAQP